MYIDWWGKTSHQFHMCIDFKEQLAQKQHDMTFQVTRLLVAYECMCTRRYVMPCPVLGGIILLFFLYYFPVSLSFCDTYFKKQDRKKESTTVGHRMSGGNGELICFFSEEIRYTAE